MGDSGPVSSPGAGAPRSGTVETTRGSAQPAAGPPAAAGTAHPLPPQPSSVVPGSATSGEIAATLAARASVFQRLASGDPAAVGDWLRRSHADPLSALIAYSARDASLRTPPVPATRPGWLARLAGRTAAPVSPLTGLGACPELGQALRAAWQRYGSRDAGRASADASSPVSPVVPQR
jgi:hypothetical protein